MKETRTINLNGIVFHIDNDAYKSLNDYLQDIELRLPADERTDVMADIEARVCELFQSAMFAKNVQVVTIEMVQSIEERIGAPSEFGENKRPKVKVKPQSERSGCSRVAKITFQVILALLAVQILLPVLAVVLAMLFALCVTAFGVGVGTFGALPLIGIELFDGSGFLTALAVISAIVAIGLPIGALVYTIVTHVRYHRGPKGRFWLIAIICWIISLGCFTALLVEQATSFGGINGIVHSALSYASNEDPDADPTALDLTAFNGISASGAVSLEVTQGDYSVSVYSPQDLVVEVKDSVLCIYCKEDENEDGYYHANISLPDLKSLHLDGASHAEVTGKFESVNYVISGASKLDAEDAPTDIVHVNCSGASKAVVHANNEIWAQASGASKIVYSGQPAVKHTMAVGASKIKRD